MNFWPCVQNNFGVELIYSSDTFHTLWEKNGKCPLVFPGKYQRQKADCFSLVMWVWDLPIGMHTFP